MHVDDRMPRVGILEPLLEELSPAVEVLLEEGVDKQFLVRVAAVDGANAHAGVVRDVVEGDAEATLCEQFPGGFEYPPPVLFGVLPQGLLRRLRGP